MSWTQMFKGNKPSRPEIVLKGSLEELYGHIKVTQVAIVYLASRAKCLEGLEEEVINYATGAWNNGLDTESDLDIGSITRRDAPALFEGLRDASEHVVGLIQLEKLSDEGRPLLPRRGGQEG